MWGGIPEQVKSLRCPGAYEGTPTYGPEDATGVLVPPQDPAALSEAVVALLADPELRAALGHNAVHDARQRFNLQRQADAYLQWYCAVLQRR